MSINLKHLDIRHVATCRFEAARSIATAPDGHRSERMHGHGFMVSAYARLPEHWPAYRGAEVSSLLRSLEKCAGLLDYRLLNETIYDPTDRNLALWFKGQLDVPGVERLAIQSTPDQGVSIEQTRACIWRRYSFQAAHQLPNVPEGHKCGRLHGHGFQVILHASIDASDSVKKVDYDILDRCWSPISEMLNYRCLNELPGLENPTSEMISSWLWARLKPELPSLSAVTVYETASCGATFDGVNYRIWKDFSIDSAVRHRHASSVDPQHAIHGYTYTLRLHLCAPLDQVMGWTVDFGDVKAVFDPIFKSLDHRPLHEQAELADGDTASIAEWIYTAAKKTLPQLECVDLFETSGCGAIVGHRLGGPVLPV